MGPVELVGKEDFAESDLSSVSRRDTRGAEQAGGFGCWRNIIISTAPLSIWRGGEVSFEWVSVLGPKYLVCAGRDLSWG